jgi:anaerobic selenocysteine-containing dehydrogenase
MDPETFRFSRLILLWGANVLSAHPHLWRPIREARKGGVFVVAIDPIRTRTAAACDLHLGPMPGTEAALALGLLYVVLPEGKEDRRFIEEHTHGWVDFRSRILEFSPERVASITGLTVESIVELGRRLAETRPTGIRIGIGMRALIRLAARRRGPRPSCDSAPALARSVMPCARGETLRVR